MALFSSKIPIGGGFSAMLRDYTPDERQKYLEDIGQYGDANEVNRHLFNMKPVYADQKLELYIDERFFLFWYDEGTFKVKHTYFLCETDLFLCFFTYSSDVQMLEFVFKHYKSFSLPMMDAERLRETMTAIERYIPIFGNISIDKEVAEFGLVDGTVFCVSRDKIEMTALRPFSKKSVTRTVPMQNVIWCEQAEISDDNTPTVKIYTVTGDDIWAFPFSSNLEAFTAVCVIKHYAPHMLYGQSDEYKRLYKKSPQQLFALAKDRESRFFKSPPL